MKWISLLWSQGDSKKFFQNKNKWEHSPFTMLQSRLVTCGRKLQRRWLYNSRVEGPVKINICCWIRKGSNILGEGFWWFLSWVRYILKFSPVRQCESKSYRIGEFDVIRQWLYVHCLVEFNTSTWLNVTKKHFFLKRSNAERNILFQADAVESIRPEVVPLW